MWAIRGSLLLAAVLVGGVVRVAEGQEGRNGWPLGQPLQPDSFYVNPEDQVVERGSHVTLECIPKDLSEVVAIVWAFVDLTANPWKVFNVLTNNTERGYYLVPHGEDRMWRDLVIPSVTDRHETGYQCRVYYRNGTERLSYYSDVAELVIHEQASLKFPDGFTDVVTTPGKSVNISIEVTGTPTPSITLQKMEDGSWINIEGKRFKVNTTLISISSVKSSDGGQYQLVLSNRPGQSTTYEFSILVESHWSAQIIESSMEQKWFPSQRCPGVTCPRILCANSRYAANDCCPSCKHSQCMFSGCVTLSDLEAGHSWKPDPCTTCYCVSGEQLCEKKACPPLDCPTELVVKKPGVCCPYCSYAKINCALIASKTVNISIAYDSNTDDGVVDEDNLVSGEDRRVDDPCRMQVTKHRCERRMLMKHGRMYKCVPRSQKRHVSVDRRCNLNRAKISYNDVTQCVGHVMGVSKAGSSEPETHCDFFVPNKARAM